MREVNYRTDCKVRLIAGQNGTLKRWEWRGRWQASNYFAKKLNSQKR
jgi:hypothetical protein